jgi:hypothetical protein
MFAYYAFRPVLHFVVEKYCFLLACYGALGCFSLHSPFEFAVLHFYLYSFYLFLSSLFLELVLVVP